VHAKDTYFNDGALNLTGCLETIGHENVKDRAWSYITLGIGHGEQWWRQFCYRLRVNGYDGWLSIEHEDIIADGGDAAIRRAPEGCLGQRAKRLRVAGGLKKVGNFGVKARGFERRRIMIGIALMGAGRMARTHAKAIGAGGGRLVASTMLLILRLSLWLPTSAQ
jgi:hypothetical protein